MSIKATVIGTAPPDLERKLAPTRMAFCPADSAPQPKPAPNLKPTTMFGTVPAPVLADAAAPPPESVKATAMTFREPEQAKPVQASALPGTQRKPLAVEVATLAQRFPGTEHVLLARVKAILAGVSLATTSPAAWLQFGMQAQEAVAKQVKARVLTLENAPNQAVQHHLARLMFLLREVLDAMDGGIFKKSAASVWQSVSPEIVQLERRLYDAVPQLTGMLGALANQAESFQNAGATAHAEALAADFLIDHVGTEAGQLLLNRSTSLTGTHALAIEQLQTVARDVSQVQELITLVQNGVLLQLPQVQSQLASLSSKPSDTERYLATEKLTEIVNFIQRKL